MTERYTANIHISHRFESAGTHTCTRTHTNTQAQTNKHTHTHKRYVYSPCTAASARKKKKSKKYIYIYIHTHTHETYTCCVPLGQYALTRICWYKFVEFSLPSYSMAKMAVEIILHLLMARAPVSVEFLKSQLVKSAY